MAVAGALSGQPYQPWPRGEASVSLFWTANVTGALGTTEPPLFDFEMLRATRNPVWFPFPVGQSLNRIEDRVKGGYDEPTSPSKYSIFACFRSDCIYGSFLGKTTVKVWIIQVLAPFPNVSMHIEQSERIAVELSNGVRAASPFSKPGHGC